MTTTVSRTSEYDVVELYEDADQFEKIRRRHDGRMPVGRTNNAIRSARRQESWRRLGRSPSWHTWH